jgi:peptide deformylase
MLEILKDDHKLLRKKAKRVDKIDDTIRNLAANMVEAMIAANGIGISGNQVGVLKRIIVVLVNEQPKVMVNPEITFQSQETCKMEEGCLSFPETFLEIERPSTVKVKYRNLSGHPVLETYEGLMARCIFHEIEHLNGVVFTERKDT